MDRYTTLLSEFCSLHSIPALTGFLVFNCNLIQCCHMSNKTELKTDQIHKYPTITNHLALLFYYQLRISTFSVMLLIKRTFTNSGCHVTKGFT